MSNTPQPVLQNTTKKGTPKTINIDAEDDTNTTLTTFMNDIKSATNTHTVISKDVAETHIHNHYHYHHHASASDNHITSIYEHVEEIAEIMDSMRNLYGIIILCVIAYGVYQYGGHTFMPPAM